MASKPTPGGIPPEMPAGPAPDTDTPRPPHPDDPVPEPGTEPWIEGP